MISKISVYIHWPFCLKKCPYCDFNSYVAKEISYKDWLTGYFNAIEAQKEFFKNKFIGSIFFGGGTPSLMEPEMVSQIINFFKNHNKVLSENLNIPHEEIQEITLESNPSTFEIKRFQDFKQAGVGRLSTGVQSFNSNNLKFLGRNHSAKESLIALEESNKIFNRTSFDLIMGLPNQSFNDWEKELQQAIPYIKEHISIYQLTIEEGTPFYKKKVPEAKEEQAILMYEHNIDVLESIGVNQYEISNFSKQNAQSYHNKNYWVGGEYIGIGPNAHGRVFFNNTWTATKEIKNPLKWLENSLKKQIKNLLVFCFFSVKLNHA